MFAARVDLGYILLSLVFLQLTDKPINTIAFNSTLPPPSGAVGGPAGLAAAAAAGAPLAGLATLGLGTGQKEWDQLSMYSQRSMPRSRAYMDRTGITLNNLT